MKEIAKQGNSRSIYIQILIVLLAFTLLVFLSSSFMSGIENKHMFNSIEAAFNDTEIHINADLKELETLLFYVSETIRLMIMRGYNFDMVSTYINDITEVTMSGDERLKEYATGIYGIFDVFDGKFHDGTGWQPPKDYVPEERPWHKAAVAANGSVGVTEPYTAMAWGIFTLTFARQIYDDGGKVLGIVCLDILLDRIREYAVNTYFTQGSYGLLLNRQLEMLAHSDKSLWGKSMRDINSSYLAVADDLEQGIPVIKRRIINYQGEASVVSFRQMKNGWHIGMVILEEAYFKEMRRMRLILIVIGIVFAAVYITILFRLSRVRKELESLKEESNLTAKEQEVFALLLRGVSPKEIGYTMNISHHTVNFHKTNLYRKLGVQSMHELFSKYSSSKQVKE